MLASLSGEVFLDVDGDGQKGATETGAAAVRVYIDANDNRVLDTSESFVDTDAQGQYSFTSLSAGDYTLRVVTAPRQDQTSPSLYLGTGYFLDGGGATQLYEMTTDGVVTQIGSPTTSRIHDLVQTNNGTLIGMNWQTDSVYVIDPVTGQETLLSASGLDLTAGLAYNPVTNTVYALARDPGNAATDTFRLHVVDQGSGQLGPAIGSGLSGLSAVSDLTFDTVNNRIVGFDNNDDQFFEFQTNGISRSLATADRPLHSWTLAFNGSSFLMFDQDDVERRATVVVDPDTGVVTDGFIASERIPSEGLFFARVGNHAQRLTLAATEAASGVDFGVTEVPDVIVRPPNLQDHPTVINEIIVDPLFGNSDTDQMLEFRGTPGGQLNPNTYFVIVEEQNSGRGVIHGIFDLSNQPLGENGMLVLLQQGSPHEVHPDSALLQSTASGFGGLPGNIYTDSHSISDRIDFIIGANGYFLIETDVPPQLGDDIDVDNDGLADLGGVISTWNVLDSVSLHPFVGSGSQAYGQILLAQEALNNDPGSRTVEPGTPIVAGDGFGYAARVGDSVGSDADDWMFGTIEESSSDNLYHLSEFGPRLPDPFVYLGRALDHYGESNFTGGVRGTIELNSGDVDINGDPLPPQPAVGLTVLADQDGNGERDLITNFVDPDAVVPPFDILNPVPQQPSGPLTNAFPGVTISTASTDNKPISFEVRAVREDVFNFSTSNWIFSHVGIDFFSDIRKLRFDFYRPVSEVSIEALGSRSSFTSVYGRIEAYNANDELIGTDLSGPLFGRSRETITVESENDDIAYAIAYADTDAFAGSSPFGRFDLFRFKQPEATAVTDENGQYEIKGLFPSNYDVTILRDDQSQNLIGVVPTRVTVQRYDNFVVNGSLLVNTAPDVVPEFAFTIEENLPEGTSIGFINAVDPDRQQLHYQLLDGADSGIVIDPDTGELTVAPQAVLDFESTPEIVLNVAVTDLLESTTTVVTVTLVDLNEAPVVEETVFSVAEDTPNGTTIGQVEAFDPDSEQAQTLSFEILPGPSDSIFAIDSSNGLITLVDESRVDFEQLPQHVLTVRVSDSSVPPMFTDIQQIIQVIDENDPPVITTTEITVDENSTGVVGVVEVADPDVAQTHIFEIKGGTGVDLFGLQRSGEVFVREDKTVDFEQGATYTLVVATVDSGAPPLADEVTITVTVVDVNEPPVLSPSFARIPENSAAGTPVTTFQIVDPENSGAAYTIALRDDADADKFQFDASSSALTVAPGADLDFETNPVNTLVFEVSDPTGVDPTTLQTFLVELTDENDAPTVLTNEIVLSELAAPGTEVARIETRDPDVGDQVTVAIVGGNAAGRFDLDPDTRILTVATGAQFDADGDPDPLVLDVEVTDVGGMSSVGQINLILNDVNEPPVFDSVPAPDTVVSGEFLQYVVPPDAVIDPEGRDFLLAIFDDSGSLPDWLSFDVPTGTLSGLATPEVVGSYPLTLRAYELGPSDLFNDMPLTVVVELGDTPLTNQREREDVDANGETSPLDALRVINWINRYGSGASVSDADEFTGFVDVTGEGVVTSRDALLVINKLSEEPDLFGELVADDSDDRDEVVDRALIDLMGQSSLF